MAGVAAAHVEAGGVAEDHVPLVHVEEREVERDGPGAQAQAQLGRIGTLGIEVGDGLLTLEPVELGRLRRAESARERDVARQGIRNPPQQPEAWREVREVIRAVRRPGVQAAAGTRHSVPVRIAVEHAVVVVVACVFETQPRFQRPARRELAVPLRIPRENARVDVVVVVLPGRADRVGGGRAARRRAVLELQQAALRDLGINARISSPSAEAARRSRTSRHRCPGRCPRPAARAGNAGGNPCANFAGTARTRRRRRG